MHPFIAYQLVQERMADLHRQARNETLTLAATGAGAKQAPARRAQVAGPGRPESQSATCPTLAKLETLSETGPFSPPPGQVSCPVGCPFTKTFSISPCDAGSTQVAALTVPSCHRCKPR